MIPRKILRNQRNLKLHLLNRKKTKETQTTTLCGVNTGDERQNTRILLQTAFVSGRNMEDTGQNIRLRIILYSGSQRTSITKRATEVLHFNTLR